MILNYILILIVFFLACINLEATENTGTLDFKVRFYVEKNKSYEEEYFEDYKSADKFLNETLKAEFSSSRKPGTPWPVIFYKGEQITNDPWSAYVGAEAYTRLKRKIDELIENKAKAE